MAIALILITIAMGFIAWKHYDDKKLMRKMYQECESGRKEAEEKLANCWSRDRDNQRIIERLKGDLEGRDELVKNLQADNRELHQKLRERSSIKAIKFVANVPHKGWTSTEFKLGLGTCGLEVVSLQWQELSDRYVLTQWHNDKTRKTFEYRKEDVKGRIEKHFN